MIENQAKEELIEMKAKEKQGGKTYRKISWVRLGVGNASLGVEVCLGIEMARLGELVINMKNPEDSFRVCLGDECLAGIRIFLFSAQSLAHFSSGMYILHFFFDLKRRRLKKRRLHYQF